MTDEEMAEEYCNNEVPFDTTENGEKLYTENDLKYAYLAGLKAGKDMNAPIKWHDLRKDPDDLPSCNDLVLFKIDTNYYLGKIDYSKKFWWTFDDTISSGFVIAWCEVPIFEG